MNEIWMMARRSKAVNDGAFGSSPNLLSIEIMNKESRDGILNDETVGERINGPDYL